ncbi:hypothetical protein C8Q79DRAFT_768792 [Trametes meyenii]|nr:hypothetical protein C8Q79DRAFT_768792 [Trametes meyenii]
MANPSTPTRAHPTDSTSSTFDSGFTANGVIPDLVVSSLDRVQFHVHRQWLLYASNNGFCGILNDPITTTTLTESAAVLDILFHTVYGLSCLHHQPALESAKGALMAMNKYGLSIPHFASPSLPLYQLILSYAAHHPIEAYVLASHYALEALAVPISAHLLAYDLSKMSDALVVEMGPIYFSRLYNLQRSRLAMLRDIVLRPPAAHAATRECGEERQQELTRAWAMASAEIVWSALPNTSTHALNSSFVNASTAVTCPECLEVLHRRLEEVTKERSAVRRTI